MEKSGRELMSEMAHTITFLTAMGFDTTDMNIETAIGLKKDILNALKPTIGEPTNKVKDAF
jgi:hypothetical protein